MSRGERLGRATRDRGALDGTQRGTRGAAVERCREPRPRRIWDPDRKMNPGKVVDPYPITPACASAATTSRASRGRSSSSRSYMVLLPSRGGAGAGTRARSCGLPGRRAARRRVLRRAAPRLRQSSSRRCATPARRVAVRV